MIRLSVLPSYHNCLMCSDLSLFFKSAVSAFLGNEGLSPHYLVFISNLIFWKMYEPNMTTFSTGFMLGGCHLRLWSQVFCWGRIIKSKLMGWPSKQGSLSLRSTLVIVAHYPADWICRKASTCGPDWQKREWLQRQWWWSRRWLSWPADSFAGKPKHGQY